MSHWKHSELNSTIRRKTRPPFFGQGPQIILSRSTTSLANEFLFRCLNAVTADIRQQSPDQALAKWSDLLLAILLVVLNEFDGQRARESHCEDLEPLYVTKAKRHIMDHCFEDFALSDLVRIVGVSPRTLQEGFRNFEGCSPMQFLCEQRLIACFRALANPRPNTTVTEVAFSSGFNHLGRFSASFEDRFGVKPSILLKNSRIQKSVAA